MKILKIRTMAGPNYWSVLHEKLIVLTLDIKELHGHTNRINGFYERLSTLFSTTDGMKDFNNLRYPFLRTAKEGTSIVHIIENIALAIQKLSGMEADYGVCYTSPLKGVYNIVFSYEQAEAGIYAAKAAVKITETIIKKEDYDLEKDIELLREIYEKNFLGPSTEALIKETEKRGFPVTKSNDSYQILGYGSKQKKILQTISNTTSFLGVEIAGDKEETKKLLAKIFIPVPQGTTIIKIEDLEPAIKQVGYPLVIKPLNGNHGRGITVNINKLEQALEGYKIAKEISETLVIEKYISGEDYRMLVVNYKFAAAVKRIPVSITGNGRMTIRNLIEKINREPRREIRRENILAKVEVDEITLNILTKNNLTLQSVLEEGRTLNIKGTANVSNGAIPIDFTDSVHPENIFHAERIARMVGLDICGIDVMSPNLSLPLDENGGAVIEVNASPGIKMHMTPSEGTQRDVAGMIIDTLDPGLIPIIAITGTNEDDTTSKLITHIFSLSKINAGLANSNGIYQNMILLKEGNFSGSTGAAHVLLDASCDLAVLEYGPEDIFNTGLAFKRCNIGIVTHISGKQWGLKDDINTLEELKEVFSVIPNSVAESGYAILNADDNLVYEMLGELSCHYALFSVQSLSNRIQEHCQNGGLAAILEDGYITICRGSEKIRIEKTGSVSYILAQNTITTIQNILPAVLCAYLMNIPIKNIRHVLQNLQWEQSTQIKEQILTK